MKTEKRTRLIWTLIWLFGAVLTGLLAARAYFDPAVSGLRWGTYAMLAGLYLLCAILWLRSWLTYDKKHKD